MPIFITSKVEWSQHCNAAFNPPDCSTSEREDQFYREYWVAHGLIRAAAERYVIGVRARGEPSARSDFLTMNEDWGHSRSVDIECHSPALVTLDFSRHLQEAARNLPERYRVTLHHDLFHFEHLFGERFNGLFDVFIDSDDIRVFSESAQTTAHFEHP